jgi:hypothetical protein
LVTFVTLADAAAVHTPAAMLEQLLLLSGMFNANGVVPLMFTFGTALGNT